jgi:hypothetical protein
MITDIFSDRECQCGAKGPDNFERLDMEETNEGVDWFVRCRQCGCALNVKVSRNGSSDPWEQG